jgi:hypothetical protein
MADNFPLTPGAGRKAATDDVTYSGEAADVQLARLVHVIGAEGSKTVVDLIAAIAAAVPGYALAIGGSDGTNLRLLKTDTNGEVQVDVLTLPALVAGTAEIGAVVSRKDLQRISVASGGLTTATTAYSAGDQMGTQFTFANAARASGGTGTIVGVILISAADIIGAVDVVITRASVTLAADNAAYAISDADALNVVALVPLTGAFDIGNNRIAQAFNLAIPYDCSGGTTLYAGLITRFAHTFFAAVTDLQLILLVERN